MGKSLLSDRPPSGSGAQPRGRYPQPISTARAAIALISPPKTPTVSLCSFLQGVRVAGYSPGPFVSLCSPSGCGLRARPFPVVPS